MLGQRIYDQLWFANDNRASTRMATNVLTEIAYAGGDYTAQVCHLTTISLRQLAVSKFGTR